MPIIKLKLFVLATLLSFGIFALILSQDQVLAQSTTSEPAAVFTEIAGYTAWKQIHKPTVPVPVEPDQIRLVSDGVLSVFSPGQTGI